MDGTGIFNRLALELSPGERKSLLQRIRNLSTISQDPLYENAEDALPVEVEEQYVQLPWYYHIGFMILSLFSSKPPVKLYKEREIAKIGRMIDAQAPGLYDHNREILLPEFHEELAELKESARFFYNALDVSVNRDRGAFYAFLGSLELEQIHNQLIAETNPALIVEKNPGVSNVELRRIAFRKMEDIISILNEDQRAAMYANVRFLFCLKELSSFLFDRVILSFAYDPAYSGMTCSALVVRELLANLNNILFSLKEIPSMSLLESLFIFMLQERMREPNFDANTECGKLIGKAEQALDIIRKFNHQVPLANIVRCASRDLVLSPVLISGGEDWLVVYRDYWKRDIEERFSVYLRTTRYQELQNGFRTFLRGINLKLLDNVESEINPGGMPVKEALNLSFLRTFHSVVFMEDNHAILHSILINGRFFNRENQSEFSESYNILNRLEDEVKIFDSLIAPEGELGMRYEAARGEMTSPTVKRRKMQLLLDEASTRALQIIGDSQTALIGMINVLNGIMTKDSVGKYDTLSNLAKVTGKGTAFMDSLVAAVQNFQTALRLIDEINLMEMER
jgi:hypothetical protein